MPEAVYHSGWRDKYNCRCWDSFFLKMYCIQETSNCNKQLDSMRWYFHRRSRAPEDCSRQNLTQAAANMHFRHPVTPGGHTMDSSATACSVRPTAHASPYHALSTGMNQHFFVFVRVTLTFDLDNWTRARFLYNAPNRQVSSSYV